MTSQVLCFVIFGCGLVLASPVTKQNEESHEVAQYTQEEIQKAVENLLKRVGQAIREVLKELFKEIGQHLHSEDLTKAVTNFKEILEKAFNEQTEGFSPSEQEIQNATNQVIQKVCEALKGIFDAFFQKIQEQAKGLELQDAVKNLQHLLNKIFSYQQKQIKTRAAPTDEQIDELSEQQLQKVGEALKDLFQTLYEQIIEKLGQQLDEEDTEELKKILEEISNHKY